MKKSNPATEQKWTNIFTLWKSSGLSQREWCKLNGISYDSFHWAVAKYKLIRKKSLLEHVISAFPNARNIFIHKNLIDIHRSFDKLISSVSDSIPTDLLYDSHFIFLSRRLTYLKVFFLDEDGPNILFKRLERGAFKMVVTGQEFGDFYKLQ